MVTSSNLRLRSRRREKAQVSKRKALRDVALRLLPGEELSFKTLRKAMRQNWGFIKRRGEWDLSSDVRFDGLRWMEGGVGVRGVRRSSMGWIRGKLCSLDQGKDVGEQRRHNRSSEAHLARITVADGECTAIQVRLRVDVAL